MVVSVREFARDVGKRQIVLNMVFVQNVEEYLEDGRSALLSEAKVSSRGLELAYLVVDQDVQ